MFITYEHIKESNHWTTYQLVNDGLSVTATWLCSFEDSPVQDGLYLCRQFAANTQEHIENYLANREVVKV